MSQDSQLQQAVLSDVNAPRVSPTHASGRRLGHMRQSLLSITAAAGFAVAGITAFGSAEPAQAANLAPVAGVQTPTIQQAGWVYIAPYHRVWRVGPRVVIVHPYHHYYWYHGYARYY